MKTKTLLLALLLALCSNTMLFAVYTVTVTAGGLSNTIGSLKTTVSYVKILGTIDASDFKTMRDSIPGLNTIDISSVTIVAYTGTKGTQGTSSISYAANTIPQYAFYNIQLVTGKKVLNSISLPSSVTTIGNYAFMDCSGLTSISLTSITTIGEAAFEMSGLVSVNIPSSLTSIGYVAFYDCMNQTSFTVDYNNPNYSSLGGALFNKAQTKLIQFPAGIAGTYNIPSTVTNIGIYAFAYCTKLTNISISNSVTTIEDGAFNGCNMLMAMPIPASVSSIGSQCFNQCTMLPSIDVDAGSSFFSSLSGVLFNKAKTQLLECPPGKPGNYSIPLTVDSILSSAFQQCNYLTSITIPSTVTYIGNYAFADCAGLTSISTSNPIPLTGSALGSGVFNNVPVTTCILKVPYGTVSLVAYQSALQWGSFNVQQIGLSVSPQMLSLAAGTATDSSKTTFSIASNMAWNASTLASWLTLYSTTGLGNKTITVAAGFNNTVNPRNDSIKITSGAFITQTIYITQAGATPVTGIAVAPTSYALTINATKQLIATVSPANATNKNITWSSSAINIATVDASGNVIAKTPGTVTITATSVDGNKTATCAVTVSALVPTITSFTPASGPFYTIVTITGTNFNTTPGNNVVFFGATKAFVTAATSTSLSAKVSPGASYQYISVTDITTGLTAYSAKPFINTFGGGAINTGSLGTKADITTGSSPYAVSICDLNSDGKPDMAVTNFYSNSVSVYTNTSSGGTISFAPKVDYTTGANPEGVSIGDLDGDGKPDLVVANANSDKVSVFLNTSTNGTVSFATKNDFQTGAGPAHISIGDLDGDGKPDLAVTNWTAGTVSVFLNTSAIGTVSFAPKTDFSTGPGPVVVAIGDLNGDGKPDLVVANSKSNTVSILLNTSTIGNVLFAAKTDISAGPGPVGVAIGDLDGDGKPDLAVANDNVATVSIFLNTSSVGTVSFTKTDITTGNAPYIISVSDLDGDGKPDLAVINSGSNTVSVLNNTSSVGMVSFAAKVDYATGGAGPQGIAIADFDGDGKPDLAASNLNSNTVSVFKNFGILPAINGLVAYYSFSGNANDLSGNGINGTVTGATLTTDRLGNANSAYSFNGTSNYITMSNLFNLSSTGSFTYNVWIQIPDSLKAFNVIFDRTTATLNMASLNVIDSVPTFEIRYDGNTSVIALSSSQKIDNTWHLLTIQRDIGKKFNLFVDTVLTAQITDNGTALTLPILEIGSNTSNPPFFTGKIDDISVFNRAISSKEIQTLYNNFVRIVTGVKLSPTNTTLSIGATQQLTATIIPSNATNQTVNWTSKDVNIATVDAKGLVTAKSSGSTIITVTTTDGSKTATCQVKISTPVTGVTVAPTTATLSVNATQQLSATISPVNATNQNVTWSSSDITIVAVDANGLATAKKGGNAIITATTSDGGMTAYCTIKVSTPVTGVTVSPTTATLSINATQQLTPTISPANATNQIVTWSTSDNTIATVDNSGLVTAKKAGTATITATTSDGGFTSTSAVTVSVPVTGVTVAPTTVTLGLNATQQLTATISPVNATNQSVAWSSSDATVATVDNTGIITAKKLGSATITATTTDVGKTATCLVTIVVPVTGVTVAPTTAALTVNGTQQLTATISPANATNQNITWSTSDISIATIDATGFVTAKKVGSATITATTSDGGKTSTCAITITVPVTGVTVSPTTATLALNATQQLTATVSPVNATNQNVTWSSSDITVASVDNTGIVTAKKVGTATIIASTIDGGKTATSTINVVTSIVAVTGVSVSPTSSTIAVSATQQLTAIISPANASNQNVAWSSSDISVATVDVTGLVTAKKAGTATITATTSDGGKTATSTITVASSVVAVTGVSVSPTSSTIAVSATQQLTATISPATASNQNVAWSSSDISIATVDVTGLVTAKKAGTATITATTSDGGKTATSAITVASSVVGVTGVSVSPTSSTIAVSATQQLTATISPATASNQNVAWSSSDITVATVDVTGLVTAKKAGTATITATTSDGGKTATSTITIASSVVAVTGVSVSPISTTLAVSGTQQLIATISPTTASNQNVAWSSSDNTVASVDVTGLVTAKKTGTATITATTSDGGKTATSTITVASSVVAVTSVSVSPTSTTLAVSGAQQLISIISPTNASNQNVAWSSSDNTVASVDVTGLVTAKKAGTATITATTSDGGKTATSTITVASSVIAVTGVSVSPTSTTLAVNATQQLAATISPATASNQNVAWSSSDISVAMVDVTGLVTAKKIGTATITATTSDGAKTATSSITVASSVIAVTGVTVSPTSTSLAVNATQQLIPTISPANASNQNVYWSSSDNTVATVDVTGLVTAKKDGKATITASTADGGKTASCTITVSSTYAIPNICMVTISLATFNNVIVWEDVNGMGITQYKIYRLNGFGSWDNIHNIPYGQTTVYEDNSCHTCPQYVKDHPTEGKHAESYLITAVNAAGETPKDSCQIHTPAFLQFNSGQLSWDPYKVSGGSFEFNSYQIYRATDSTKLAAYGPQISKTISKWTDGDPLAATKRMYYTIGVVKLQQCYPHIAGTVKASGDIYSQSFSNLEDNKLKATSLPDLTNLEFNLNIYPNPSNGVATISYKLERTSDLKIVVTDLMGKEIKSLLDTKGQAEGEYSIELNTNEFETNSGVFLLKLKAGNSIVTKKLLIVK